MDNLGRPLFDLPCVQVGKTNAKFFPVEVVCIVDDQYYMKKLNPDQQSTMTTRCGEQKPSVRFQENQLQINKLIQSAARCETDYFASFGIKLVTPFSEVNGRYLPKPRICGSNGKEKNITDGEWKDSLFAIPANVDNNFKWLVVNYSQEYKREVRWGPDRRAVDSLIKGICEQAKFNGLNLGQPVEVIYDENYDGKVDVKNAIGDYAKDFPGLKFILFIIPENDELYSFIKFFSELDFGITTQCVSHKKSRRFHERTYAGNVVLKINSKLGGINCHLKSECKGSFRTMGVSNFN